MQRKFNQKKMVQVVNQTKCHKLLGVVGMALLNKEFKSKVLMKLCLIKRKMDKQKP